MVRNRIDDESFRKYLVKGGKESKKLRNREIEVFLKEEYNKRMKKQGKG